MRFYIVASIALCTLVGCGTTQPSGDTISSGSLSNQADTGGVQIDEITLSGTDPLIDFEERLDDIMLPNASLPEWQAAVVPPPAFGQELSLALNESVVLPDGLEMTLVAVSDNRCPDNPLVECNSPGEVTAQIMAQWGKLTSTSQFSLGTVTRGAVITEWYIVQIVRGDEKSVVISASILVQGE